jgi:hypothetical protein
MKNKIISINNTTIHSSSISRLANWFRSFTATPTLPSISMEEKHIKDLTYLKEILSSFNSNPLHLNDPQTSIMFLKNKKQLELYFIGELPMQYNYLTSSARNNYFQKGLQKLINKLYSMGICETNELSTLTKKRNHTIGGSTATGKGEQNRWYRTRETWGPKSTCQKVSVKIMLTENGAALIEEALNDPKTKISTRMDISIEY